MRDSIQPQNTILILHSNKHPHILLETDILQHTVIIRNGYLYTLNDQVLAYTFRFNLFISSSIWMERESSIGRRKNKQSRQTFLVNMQSKRWTSPWLLRPRAKQTLLRPNIKVILLFAVCVCHEHPWRLSTVIRQHSQHTICNSVLMKGVGRMPTSRSGFSTQSAHVCWRAVWLQSLSSTSCETPCMLWLSLRWPCTPYGPHCLPWGSGQLLVNNEYVNEENVCGMTKVSLSRPNHSGWDNTTIKKMNALILRNLAVSELVSDCPETQLKHVKTPDY